MMFFLIIFLIFREFAKTYVFSTFWIFPKVKDFAKLAFFASFSDSPNLGNHCFFAFSQNLNISAWRQTQA